MKKILINFQRLVASLKMKLKERIICDYISGMTDRYASKTL